MAEKLTGNWIKRGGVYPSHSLIQKQVIEVSEVLDSQRKEINEYLDAVVDLNKRVKSVEKRLVFVESQLDSLGSWLEKIDAQFNKTKRKKAKK